MSAAMGRADAGRVRTRRPGGIFPGVRLLVEFTGLTTSAFERNDLTGFHPDGYGFGGSYLTGIFLGDTYETNDENDSADGLRRASISASTSTTAT